MDSLRTARAAGSAACVRGGSARRGVAAAPSGQEALLPSHSQLTSDRVDIELSYISDITDASKGKLLIHVKGLNGDGLANVESWLSIAAKSSVKDRRALLQAFAVVQPNYVRLALLCCIWSNLVEAVSDLEGPTVAMAAGLYCATP